MPSLRMKTTVSKDSIREKHGLRISQNSSIISKPSSCSQYKISPQIAESETHTNNYCCVPSSTDISSQAFENSKAIERQAMLDEEKFQLRVETSTSADSTSTKEPTQNCESNLETIFSPAFEPTNVFGEPIFGSNNFYDIPWSWSDDYDINSCSNQTNQVSEFLLSDMNIASLPFYNNRMDDDAAVLNPFPDYACPEPNMLLEPNVFYDVAEQYMLLPFLEETATSNMYDVKPDEGGMIDSVNNGLCLANDKMSSCGFISDSSDSQAEEDFDPQLFIRNLPELSDVEPNRQPIVLPKDNQRRKAVTLVLDLDETLVHSTLDHWLEADFTFEVFFNMKEHTVYVKQRPHLHAFLEKVAEMFDVVIFTASQSIYASQLLDILDPEGNLISKRVYRESCIFSDGSYTKDLTILGLDLAKVAIIDNSPQVFRLQVDNGIPIKSWFDDSSDNALLSLLPFLETLADSDDVRPMISKRFGTNGQQ